MRRMLSNKNVVDVVNEAIDEGEITVGGLPEIESGDAGKALIVNSGETGVEWGEVGLSPEDQAKLNNSLQLPESAPAAQQLVGINTSGEQNAIGIGSGLEIKNNSLDAKFYVIDFNGGLTASISDELVSEMSTSTLSKPLTIVNSSIALANGLIYTREDNGNNYSASTTSSDGVNFFDKNGYYAIAQLKVYELVRSGTAGNYILTLSQNSTRLSTAVKNQTTQFRKEMTALTGTLAAFNPSFSEYFVPLYMFYYKETSNIFVYFKMLYFDKSTNTLYGEGESATYKYTLTITTNTRAYTITQTAK